MTRSQYQADQKNDKRQDGTTKGKRAVRTFLRAIAERMEGSSEAAYYEAGAWGKMAAVNNLFWKWVGETPPWGSPDYNGVYVTSAFTWDFRVSGWRLRYRGTVDNTFHETSKDWMMRWALYRIMRMEMKRVERQARWRYIKMRLRRKRKT